MEQADASWWGSAAEFKADIRERLDSPDPQVRQEAQRLLAARNARARQGRDPFAPNPAPPANDPPQAPGGPQAADRPRPAPARPRSMSAHRNPQDGFGQAMGPVAQAKHLGGMIDQVTGAIAGENASRVAISREQRRMAHEQEMEAMRTEALLKRLEMEAREREKDRILQKQLATGVTTRKLINGEWVDV